jgi:hypothetical protein
LDFVQRLIFKRTQRFVNWIWCHPQVKGCESPTPLGPLERANLNHWTRSYSLEHETMDNVQNLSNPECYTFLLNLMKHWNLQPAIQISVSVHDVR